MSAFLLVSAGGFVGANLRYGISIWSARRLGTTFPVGTMLANLSGSLLIGLIFGLLAGWLDNDRDIRLLLATGVLGAETTFSTYTFETLALLRQGLIRDALRYYLGSVVLGLTAVAAGLMSAYVITDVL
jgi:CrcB protein